MTSARKSVLVTVFSSIAEVAPSLQKAAPNLPLNVIEDKSLGGYGGTIEFDPKKISPNTKEKLRSAEILITEPSVLAALLQQDATCLPCLKWCQSTYAGVDPLFNAGLTMPLPFRLTRFAGKFGPPIAEWVIARIIGHERNFALTASDQTKGEWAASRQVTKYRYLRDLTLTILGGSGDIGTCIGKAAQAFNMKVIGQGKTSRENETIPGLDLYTTDLTKALQEADYIVSVLPSTPQTRGMLSGDGLRPANGAVFINVGRGDIIDEESLIRALDEKHISAAILDVFATEPLPKESQLWKNRDVVVSPHVSGVTREEDVPDIVLENYQRYLDEKQLMYQVDWAKGY